MVWKKELAWLAHPTVTFWGTQPVIIENIQRTFRPPVVGYLAAGVVLIIAMYVATKPHNLLPLVPRAGLDLVV